MYQVSSHLAFENNVALPVTLSYLEGLVAECSPRLLELLLQSYEAEYNDIMHLYKRMHHTAHLFGLSIPFAQRVEYKVCFLFDPIGGMINQFADILIATSVKRPPANSLLCC